MTTQTSYVEKSAAVIYYLFAFLLLWEWLRPLNVFSNTANTFVFIFFIAVSFLLILFKARWYLSFPVKIIIILFILHGMFYQGVFLSFGWITDLIEDTVNNIQLIPTANWMSMTASYRTLLFFILLWLLVYLIHYWVLIQKRILIFFVLTLLYITVLDTFTQYDATFAIVRTVLIGFFMLGMLYFDRLKKIENLQMKGLAFFRWLLPLFAFIVLSMVVAMLAPKASPQWPDPVPYLTAVGNGEEGIGGRKKIGYSESDENLGGGFVEDDTEVFTHISSERHYWRIETKDVYTGKGWIASEQENDFEEITNIQDELFWTDESVKTKQLESTVTFNNNYRHFHLMYPLGVTSIQTENNLDFYLNPNTELITPFPENNGSREQFKSYKVTYNLPTYSLDEMRKVQNLPESDPIHQRYTQLPDSLPSRVRDLAIRLTMNETNQYDKTKAIEEYLGSADFTYDKDDVAIPEGEQDYVDQFLFETLKGYCDNFSTSMIVLLRAVDIPARWVKGYTEGDFVDVVNETEREYKVTNNNAHSWVEVYFEGVGWVPFEPTKGFINPYTVSNETQSNETEDVPEQQQQTPEEETQQAEAEKSEQEKQTEKEVEEATASAENQESSLLDMRIGSAFVYSLLVIILIASFILYKTRLKWLAHFIVRKYKNRHDEEVFFHAFQSLLKQLERKGMKRKDSQTLREYAHTIDHVFQDKSMTILTENYERALYRRTDAEKEWVKSAELWENLIKKTSS